MTQGEASFMLQGGEPGYPPLDFWQGTGLRCFTNLRQGYLHRATGFYGFDYCRLRTKK